MPETQEIKPTEAEKIKKEKSTKPLAKAPAKKRKPIRKFFKSFVDVKKWVAYDEVSSNTKNTVGLYSKLFRKSPKETRKETYDEAIARLGMSQEQVTKREKTLLASAMTYAICGFGLFIYLIYLTINLHLIAALLNSIIICLLSLLAYKDHFWYMQMKQKKLGCSFRDWIQFILRGAR